MADIHIHVEPFLIGGQLGQELYVVEGDVLAWFTNNNAIPAHISEWQLRVLLTGACQNFQTADAVLAQHFTNCRARLMNVVGQNAQSREMVGEILAAAAIARVNAVHNTAWHMVRGYGGHGHTGIDQIWSRTNEVLIVEAKGGQGQLDDTPRYEQGMGCEGRLGFQGNSVYSLQGSLTQLSAGWVFIGCNHHILGGKFGNAMLNDAAFGVPVLGPTARLAVMVCLALWNPDPLLHAQAPGNFKHDVGLMGKTVAPTGKLNTLMNWDDDLAITLPKVITIVIVNGKMVLENVIADKHVVFTARRPDRDDDEGGGKPHRFKPGLMHQIRDASPTVY